MEPIRFTVRGDPQGQPRPQSQGVLGRDGKAYAHVFHRTRKRGKDGVVRDLPITVWRRAIAYAVRSVLPPEPWTGPVRLDVEFYFERTEKLMARKYAGMRLRHASKPDVDNAVKPLMDEMVEKREGGIVVRRGLIRDDNQVCEVHATKWWADQGAVGGAVVTLTQLWEPAPVLPFKEPRKTHIGGFKLAEPKPDGWTAAEQMAADMRGEIQG